MTEQKTQQERLQEIADAHRASQQESAAQQEQGPEQEEQDDEVQQPADAVVTPTGTAKRKQQPSSDVDF